MGVKIFFHEVIGMPVAMWELRHKLSANLRPRVFDSIRRRVSTLMPINYGKFASVYTARSAIL